MLILASASPRRLQLLEQVDIAATVIPANIDEKNSPHEPPKDYVCRLAYEKAQSIAKQYPNDVVLAADTIVSFADELFGKPENKQQAFTMWQKLSGNTHQVYTAMTVMKADKVWQALSTNEVTFTKLTDVMMQNYWESGEPCDKAGGYAIQGHAAKWITKLNGSYSGVMGLDLYLCSKLLLQAGVVV